MGADDPALSGRPKTQANARRSLPNDLPRASQQVRAPEPQSPLPLKIVPGQPGYLAASRPPRRPSSSRLSRLGSRASIDCPQEGASASPALSCQLSRSSIAGMPVHDTNAPQPIQDDSVRHEPTSRFRRLSSLEGAPSMPLPSGLSLSSLPSPESSGALGNGLVSLRLSRLGTISSEDPSEEAASSLTGAGSGSGTFNAAMAERQSRVHTQEKLLAVQTADKTGAAVSQQKSSAPSCKSPVEPYPLPTCQKDTEMSSALAESAASVHAADNPCSSVSQSLHGLDSSPAISLEHEDQGPTTAEPPWASEDCNSSAGPSCMSSLDGIPGTICEESSDLQEQDPGPSQHWPGHMSWGQPWNATSTLPFVAHPRSMTESCTDYTPPDTTGSSTERRARSVQDEAKQLLMQPEPECEAAPSDPYDRVCPGLAHQSSPFALAFPPMQSAPARRSAAGSAAERRSIDLASDGSQTPILADGETLESHIKMNRGLSAAEGRHTQPRALQRSLGQTFPGPGQAWPGSSFTAGADRRGLNQEFPLQGVRSPDSWTSAGSRFEPSTSNQAAPSELIPQPESKDSSRTPSNAGATSFSELVQEIAVMKKLAHPNIVKLHEVRSVLSAVQWPSKSIKCSPVPCYNHWRPLALVLAIEL